MEGESYNLEKNIDGKFGHMVHDGGTVLQPIRVRHSPVLANESNWKFVESEFRFVLLSGALFWTIFLLSMAI